jgi:phosphoribosylaminoimidazole-succinocarboxamide synthase
MPKRYSTKNLEVQKEPTDTSAGVGVFEFTDDYSVFHYGKMPDRIPDKGEAIARMAAANFELFERNGVPTHFRGMVEPTKLEIDVLPAPNPDETPIGVEDGWYVIPLQVVYRNSLPPGASVFRRLDEGSVTLEQLGFSERPEPGTKLDEPLIEFTTKREEIDRFIDEEEAMRIAGLSSADLGRLKQMCRQIDALITEKAESLGLEHADGKIEFGMLAPGELILVDNAGTPDENRFLYDGYHVGKQVMRDFYLQGTLERDVQEWAAAGRPRSTWPQPEPLPAGFIEPISEMYKSLAETWTGEQIWGALSLDEVVATVRLLNTGAVNW